jgi:hypothetical protein
VLTVLLSTGWAQEATDESSAAEGDIAVALTAAKQAYFRGQHLEAQTRLSALNVRLLKGEPVPAALRHEVRTWLGEVLFRLDRSDEARLVFRQILEENSEWPIDEYQHGVEVVAVYYDVRRQVLAARAAEPGNAPEARQRPPIWTLLPLGIAQYVDERPLAGTAHLLLQGALATTSIALYAELDRTNVPEIGHPQGLSAEQIAERQTTLRWAVQYPSTVLFYVAAVAGVVEARAHYNRNSVAVQPVVGPGGAGVHVVVGRRRAD